MIFRSIALAAIAATSIGAQAALTTYAPWDAAPANSTKMGVEFNVQSGGGVTVALGAHAYRNGVLLPNNGVSTYSAQNGVFGSGPNPNYANWSFDFAWDLGSNCNGCTVTLQADKDPTANVQLVDLFSTAAVPAVYAEGSWNMEMAFIDGLLGYNFDPFGPSSTAFSLEVKDAQGLSLARSDITVNVPEPGSLALLGLGLAGLAALRRRKA